MANIRIDRGDGGQREWVVTVPNWKGHYAYGTRTVWPVFWTAAGPIASGRVELQELAASQPGCRGHRRVGLREFRVFLRIPCGGNGDVHRFPRTREQRSHQCPSFADCPARSATRRRGPAGLEPPHSRGRGLRMTAPTGKCSAPRTLGAPWT